MNPSDHLKVLKDLAKIFRELAHGINGSRYRAPISFAMVAVLLTTSIMLAQPIDENRIDGDVQPIVERTLTDTEGRQTQGEIIGRNETVIKFRRDEDQIEFEIPISNLSQQDQQFLASLPKGEYLDPDQLNQVAQGEEPQGSQYQTIMDPPNEVFLALPFQPQDRGGICTAAAILNTLQYIDPEIKLTQEEMFRMMSSGRRGAGPYEIEAALKSIGYRVDMYTNRANRQGYAERIRTSLNKGLPVLSANNNHMMVTVGYNTEDDTFTLWDQRRKGESNVENRPPGASELRTAAFTARIRTILILTPLRAPRARVAVRHVALETLGPSKPRSQVRLHYNTITPPPRQTPEDYMEHMLEPRIALELRRNRRVFIHLKAGNYWEIVGEAERNRWPVKMFPATESEEIEQKTTSQIIQAIMDEKSQFIAVQKL